MRISWRELTSRAYRSPNDEASREGSEASPRSGILSGPTPLGIGTRRVALPGLWFTRKLEVHHMMARSKLGDDAEENLITLCSQCHRHIHSK